MGFNVYSELTNVSSEKRKPVNAGVNDMWQLAFIEENLWPDGNERIEQKTDPICCIVWHEPIFFPPHFTFVRPRVTRQVPSCHFFSHFYL